MEKTMKCDPIRSAQDVINVARSRGFDVKIDPGPPRMPVLVRPKNVPMSLVTETLMQALRAWRVEIMALIEKV